MHSNKANKTRGIGRVALSDFDFVQTENGFYQVIIGLCAFQVCSAVFANQSLKWLNGTSLVGEGDSMMGIVTLRSASGFLLCLFGGSLIVHRV